MVDAETRISGTEAKETGEEVGRCDSKDQPIFPFIGGEPAAMRRQMWASQLLTSC